MRGRQPKSAGWGMPLHVNLVRILLQQIRRLVFIKQCGRRLGLNNNASWLDRWLGHMGFLFESPHFYVKVRPHPMRGFFLEEPCSVSTTISR